MPTYNELKFVQPGFESHAGDWSDSDRAAIQLIRQAHPELSSWGDLAIGLAWGDYSQDVLYVNWCDWLIGQRDSDFLAYILNP